MIGSRINEGDDDLSVSHGPQPGPSNQMEMGLIESGAYTQQLKENE